MSFCTCLNTFFGASAGTTPTSKTQQQQEAKGGRTPTAITAPTAVELTRTPRTPHDLDMKSPTVQVTNNSNISGKGIVLASLALEQDSAYWQVKCLKPGQFSLGVSRALDAKALAEDNLMWGVDIGIAGTAGAGAEDGEEETKEEKTTVTAEAGDVFGLALDLCGVPMLRIYKNGIELEGQAINRVRGLVFPAIRVQPGAELVFLFHQDDWAYPPPSSKLSMILQSRNMM